MYSYEILVLCFPFVSKSVDDADVELLLCGISSYVDSVVVSTSRLWGSLLLVSLVTYLTDHVLV